LILFINAGVWGHCKPPNGGLRDFVP